MGERRSAGDDKHRLAVLPLANISPDPGDEYFADGMTEEIIATLSKVTRLRVIARTSAMKFKGATKTVAEIGEELGVQSLLEGSVRKAEGKVRITVQLIEAKTQEPLWSRTYDRTLEDIFVIQSDIAQKVARALRVQIAHRERLAIEKRATDVLEAYTLYLKGRYNWNKRTDEGLRTAISQFEAALEKDLSYSRAYSGIADAYASLALFEILPPHDAFPKARAAAERALELDDGLAEPHASLGLVRFQYTWDWAGAESEFKRAIELDPSYPPAHQFYADYLKAMGRFDEAMAQMSIARELDPLNLSINTGLGHVLYLSRRYDEAIAQYRRVLEMDPTFLQTRLWFGRPYLQKGMYREAIEELQEAVRLSSGSTMALAVLGHACAAAGRKQDALRILRSLMERAESQYLPSYWIALIHTGLDDKDAAFEWLERAFRERSSWLVWSGVEPRFDILRPDLRFAQLLNNIGLMTVGEMSEDVGRHDDRAVTALLHGLSTLKLSRFRVVGNYYRHEADARNLLKDLKQKIAASLGAANPRNENYLIWSPPGGGKTFFVQQVRSSVGPEVVYREANLAQTDESEFRSWLAKGTGADGAPSLSFVDEIDSKPEEPWPYEALLPYLESGGSGKLPRVFVLAGSSGRDLETMVKTMASRPKGMDLLSRVPHMNLCSIPPMTVRDRLLVILANLHEAAKTQGRRLTEIEKLALYYMLLNPQLSSARQIREFTARCLQRLPRGEDRVKYDHLFEPGDAVNKEFWMKARTLAPSLVNAFLMIEE